MAFSDKLVIPEEVPRKERRVKGKNFARQIQWEKMRKALVVVVEALEPKNKDSGSREALVETGKEAMAVDENQTERSVEALLEALGALVDTGKDAVAVDNEQTESSAIDIFDEYEFVDDEFSDDPSREVDEEVLKEINEVLEECKKNWLDCVDQALRAGIIFDDSAFVNPGEEAIALSS